MTKKQHPLNPDVMRVGARRAATTVKLLANENRLILLCRIAQGEICVSDLERELGIRQPTLSQQLTVLRNENAVSTRRDGKNIYYSVADPTLLELVAVLYGAYCHGPGEAKQDATAQAAYVDPAAE